MMHVYVGSEPATIVPALVQMRGYVKSEGIEEICIHTRSTKKLIIKGSETFSFSYDTSHGSSGEAGIAALHLSHSVIRDNFTSRNPR